MTLQAKSEGTQMGEEADEKVKVMVEEEKSEEPKTSVEDKSMENGEEDKSTKPESEEGKKIGEDDTPSSDSVALVKKSSSFKEEKSEEPKTLVEDKSMENGEEDKSTKPESEEGKKIGEDDTPSSDSVALVKKSSSFKEESNLLSDLKDHERKALIELRAKIEESIIENNLFKKEEKHEKQKQEKEELKDSESEGEKPKTQENAMPTTDGKTIDGDISLWGVPLFPGKSSEGTDLVLLKFLRARDFKVKESLEMLKSSLQWRKESKIDSILDEDSLGADLGAACYMDGLDREGHPVCYNVPGVFLDDVLYQKVFGTEESRAKFLRWRVQIMEKGIKKLDLRPGGTASLLQITDLNNAPGPSKKELRTTMKQAVQLLQDNYPEFVARNIFINVPFWYYAFYALFSPFLTQRTRSKMVFARPANVTETLLQYIPAEAIPICYGGLKHNNDEEFSIQDDGCGVSEFTVKAGSTETVEIPAQETGITLLWDLTVLGWEVSYKEEFVPTDEGSYTIIIKKGKKFGFQDGPVRNSFRSNEPGKVLLTVENNTFKKKKILFRYKTKGEKGGL